MLRLISKVFVFAIWLFAMRICIAVDITPTAGSGPTPQQLAESIADQSGGVSVVANSASTAIKNQLAGDPDSDPRAMGSFANGITAAGTPLPSINGGPSATYAGGISIGTGVCLCTGMVSDSLATAGTGLGYGLEGPNNGDGEGILPNGVNHTGEITSLLTTGPSQVPLSFVDEDFENFAFPDNDPGGGDPTVLEFEVSIGAPGFLRISFVFGSDEYPFYTDPLQYPFNDSVAIIIDDENVATTTVDGATTPFDLFEISDCGPAMFFENDTAPSPTILTQSNTPPSVHAIPTAPRYNVEFGGFTKRLTREVSCPLAPGTHRIKIVVQDVSDRRVDAGVFLEENSLTLFALQQGDYNGDGIVNTADYTVWSTHYGQSPAQFYDGDGSGNGIVDAADYVLWRKNRGKTGNADLSADFNRDGCVDEQDFAIWQQYGQSLSQCASRFEGDADHDGDVDDRDEEIWEGQNGNCSGGNSAMAAGEDSFDTSSAASQTPESADMDGDGDVDQQDIAALDEVIRGAAYIEPTLAE